MYRRAALFACALSLPPRIAPASAAEGRWEQIEDEDGVTVWQRDVPGSSLVEFKGEAEIQANLLKVLAVLHDQDRKTEWLARCRENRLIRAKSVSELVVYNRIRSDFPLVSDRDVVFATSVKRWPDQRRVQIDARSVEDPLAPPVDGVQRMPKLKLQWTLVAADRNRTLATYQVQADPGGSIPHWVVNLVSRSVPLRTLSQLREQVTKEGYERNLGLIEVAFDWERWW